MISVEIMKIIDKGEMQKNKRKTNRDRKEQEEQKLQRTGVREKELNDFVVHLSYLIFGFDVFFIIMKGVPIITNFKRPISQTFD